MRRSFFAVLACAVSIEVLRAYLMLGYPGTENVESLQAAHFLDANRWILRAFFLLLAAWGAVGAFRVRRKWIPALAALAAVALAWFADSRTDVSRFEMAENVGFGPLSAGGIDEKERVIGVVHNGEAKAYPVKYLRFHHQVRDSIGGMPVIVTFCLVCGTGRVYEPVVRGRPEQFRLVALNRHNAVFEDASTGSWWMQATGRAEAGPLSGLELRELDTEEFSARKFLDVYPNALFMQPVADALDDYAIVAENVRRMKRSWVVRVERGPFAKAFDWASLVKQRFITDEIGGKQVTLVLGKDDVSISAFEHPVAGAHLSVAGGKVLVNGRAYNFAHRATDGEGKQLPRPSASWETSACWEEFKDDR